MRQGQVDRAARLRPHGGDRMANPMIEVVRRRHSLRQPRERSHDCSVVERRLARILKGAAILEVERHLARHDQHGRAVRLGGGNRSGHIASARPADAERRAEAAAGACIAVRHVDGPAFVRGDYWLDFFLPGKRRQEWIDQAAGNHEQMTEPLGDERIEYLVGAELGRGCHRRALAERMVAIVTWNAPYTFGYASIIAARFMARGRDCREGPAARKGH